MLLKHKGYDGPGRGPYREFSKKSIPWSFKKLAFEDHFGAMGRLVGDLGPQCVTNLQRPVAQYCSPWNLGDFVCQGVPERGFTSSEHTSEQNECGVALTVVTKVIYCT